MLGVGIRPAMTPRPLYPFANDPDVNGLVFSRLLESDLNGPGAIGGGLVNFSRKDSSTTTVGSRYAPIDATGALRLFTANQPRFSYGGSNPKPGLLVEAATSSRVPYSTDHSQWTVSGVGTVLTLNAATAPDGTLTASTLFGALDTAYLASPALGVTNANGYYATVWLKADASCTVVLTIMDPVDNSPKTQLSASVTTAWQRFLVRTFTCDSTAHAGKLYIGDPTAAGFPAGRTVSVWNSMVLLDTTAGWPTQSDIVNPGSATSYGPSADDACLPMPTGFAAAQGTISIWVMTPTLIASPTTNSRGAMGLSSTTNRALSLYACGASTGKPQVIYGSGSAAITIISATGLTGFETWDHLLFTWDATGGVLYLNGVNVASSATAPSILLDTTLWLGRITSGNNGNIWIRNAKGWNKVLSAGEIAAEFAAGA